MADRVVALDGGRVTGWDSFHAEFSRLFGFPNLYGRNMNAWIDCLTGLDEEDGMRSITTQPGEVLTLRIDHYGDLKHRCPKLVEAIVEGAAFVNWRRLDQGQPAVLALAFRR